MLKVSITRTQNKDAINKIKDSIRPKVTRGLMAVANHLYERSSELVPVDTRSLVGSGKVRPSTDIFTWSITVGYGTEGEEWIGSAESLEGRTILVRPEKYAVYVHENITMQHPRGGQAEFLRTPLLQDFQEMKTIFLAAAKLS